MDKLIVFVIIAVAAGFVIRRFFFKKGNTCGCGCASGGCGGGSGSAAKGADGCCSNGQQRP